MGSITASTQIDAHGACVCSSPLAAIDHNLHAVDRIRNFLSTLEPTILLENTESGLHSSCLALCGTRDVAREGIVSPDDPMAKLR